MIDSLLVRGLHAPTQSVEDTTRALREGTAVIVRPVPSIWHDVPLLTGTMVTVDPMGGAPVAPELPALQLELPASVLSSVAARRRTFLAGRACAALAVQRHGIPIRTPIGIAEHRGPQWPPGLVGSISHTSDLAIAVVAPSRAYRGVGVDIQPLLSLDVAREVAPMIAPEWPIDRGDLADLPEVWARDITAIFSAKESLFKCVRPLVCNFFDFTDARVVSWEPSAGRGQLRLLRTLGEQAPAGLPFDVALRWHDQTLHSLIVWPA